MNKSIVSLLMLASLVVTGCSGHDEIENGSSSSSQTSPDTSSSQDSSTSEESSQDCSSSEATIDEVIKLTTFGDLYKNSFRSIYATLEKGGDYEVAWKSSDPKVLDIMVREDTDKEAFVYQTGFGTATVTAYLVDYPGVKASKTYTIKEGEVMPKDLFSKVSGAMKVTTEDYTYSYDQKFNCMEDEHFTLTTIYEEMGGHVGDTFTSTDAYEFRSVNTKNNKEVNHYKYIRSSKGYVAQEKIDLNNKLSETIIPNSEGNPIMWEGSIYANLFGKDSLISNKDFVSVDNGKTYHYTGLSENATDVLTSMYLFEVSADDLYFTNDNGNLTLTAELEPFDYNPNAIYRSARKFVSTFSEIDSATISHLKPNAHQDYHDDITTALNKLKEGKNYTVNTTLRFKEGLEASQKYQFKINPNDIYYEYRANDVLKGRYGVHKLDGDKYYDYCLEEQDDKSLNVIITKDYESGYSEYLRTTLPSFNYSAELFQAVEGKQNTYETVDNNGAIILRSFILSTDYRFYTFPGKAIITLDDNKNLSTFETEVKDGNKELIFKAEFSKVGETSIDFDFENAKKEELPASWESANASLFNDMKLWNIQDSVPYLAAKNGYSGFVGKQLDDGYRLMYASISTNNFDNSTDRDQFIKDYKALLIKEGFEDTGIDEPFTGYRLFKKASFQIGVGIKMNRRHNSMNETDAAMIIVKSPLLVEPEY